MNKWLNMGKTPVEVIAKKKHVEDHRFPTRNPIAFLEETMTKYPNGFTLEDLVASHGRYTVYWSRYIYSLRYILPGIVKNIGHQKRGIRARIAIYRIAPELLEDFISRV